MTQKVVVLFEIIKSCYVLISVALWFLMILASKILSIFDRILMIAKVLYLILDGMNTLYVDVEEGRYRRYIPRKVLFNLRRSAITIQWFNNIFFFGSNNIYFITFCYVVIHIILTRVFTILIPLYSTSNWILLVTSFVNCYSTNYSLVIMDNLEKIYFDSVRNNSFEFVYYEEECKFSNDDLIKFEKDTWFTVSRYLKYLFLLYVVLRMFHSLCLHFIKLQDFIYIKYGLKPYAYMSVMDIGSTTVKEVRYDYKRKDLEIGDKIPGNLVPLTDKEESEWMDLLQRTNGMVEIMGRLKTVAKEPKMGDETEFKFLKDLVYDKMPNDIKEEVDKYVRILPNMKYRKEHLIQGIRGKVDYEKERVNSNYRVIVKLLVQDLFEGELGDDVCHDLIKQIYTADASKLTFDPKKGTGYPYKRGTDRMEVYDDVKARAREMILSGGKGIAETLTYYGGRSKLTEKDKEVKKGRIISYQPFDFLFIFGYITQFVGRIMKKNGKRVFIAYGFSWLHNGADRLVESLRIGDNNIDDHEGLDSDSTTWDFTMPAEHMKINMEEFYLWLVDKLIRYAENNLSDNYVLYLRKYRKCFIEWSKTIGPGFKVLFNDIVLLIKTVMWNSGRLDTAHFNTVASKCGGTLALLDAGYKPVWLKGRIDYIDRKVILREEVDINYKGDTKIVTSGDDVAMSSLIKFDKKIISECYRMNGYTYKEEKININKGLQGLQFLGKKIMTVDGQWVPYRPPYETYLRVIRPEKANPDTLPNKEQYAVNLLFGLTFDNPVLEVVYTPLTKIMMDIMEKYDINKVSLGEFKNKLLYKFGYTEEEIERYLTPGKPLTKTEIEEIYGLEINRSIKYVSVRNEEYYKLGTDAILPFNPELYNISKDVVIEKGLVFKGVTALNELRRMLYKYNNVKMERIIKKNIPFMKDRQLFRWKEVIGTCDRSDYYLVAGGSPGHIGNYLIENGADEDKVCLYSKIPEGDTPFNVFKYKSKTKISDVKTYVHDEVIDHFIIDVTIGDYTNDNTGMLGTFSPFDLVEVAITNNVQKVNKSITFRIDVGVDDRLMGKLFLFLQKYDLNEYEIIIPAFTNWFNSTLFIIFRKNRLSNKRSVKTFINHYMNASFLVSKRSIVWYQGVDMIRGVNMNARLHAFEQDFNVRRKLIERAMRRNYMIKESMSYDMRFFDIFKKIMIKHNVKNDDLKLIISNSMSTEHNQVQELKIDILRYSEVEKLYMCTFLKCTCHKIIVIDNDVHFSHDGDLFLFLSQMRRLQPHAVIVIANNYMSLYYKNISSLIFKYFIFEPMDAKWYKPQFKYNRKDVVLCVNGNIENHVLLFMVNNSWISGYHYLCDNTLCVKILDESKIDMFCEGRHNYNDLNYEVFEMEVLSLSKYSIKRVIFGTEHRVSFVGNKLINFDFDNFEVILFTSNTFKVKIYKYILGKTVHNFDYDPLELQASVKMVSLDKMKKNIEIFRKRDLNSMQDKCYIILVEDTGLDTELLNTSFYENIHNDENSIGFPDPFTKFLEARMRNADFFKLCKGSNKYGAREKHVLSVVFARIIKGELYCSTLKTISSIVEGKIVGHNLNLNTRSYDNIFKPNTLNKVYAEMNLNERSKHTARGNTLRKLNEVLVGRTEDDLVHIDEARIFFTDIVGLEGSNLEYEEKVDINMKNTVFIDLCYDDNRVRVRNVDLSSILNGVIDHNKEIRVELIIGNKIYKTYYSAITFNGLSTVYEIFGRFDFKYIRRILGFDVEDISKMEMFINGMTKKIIKNVSNWFRYDKYLKRIVHVKPTRLMRKIRIILDSKKNIFVPCDNIPKIEVIVNNQDLKSLMVNISFIGKTRSFVYKTDLDTVNVKNFMVKLYHELYTIRLKGKITMNERDIILDGIRDEKLRDSEVINIIKAPQLKLLETESAFMLKEHRSSKNVIYFGAAKGTHIYTLVNMYKEHSFILIDRLGRKHYHSNLKKCENVQIITMDITTKSVKGLRSKYHKNCIIIDDVWDKNMMLNKRIHLLRTIEPKAALVKFLYSNYDKELSISYPRGVLENVSMQKYASKELRLYISSENMKYIHDARQYTKTTVKALDQGVLNYYNRLIGGLYSFEKERCINLKDIEDQNVKEIFKLNKGFFDFNGFCRLLALFEVFQKTVYINNRKDNINIRKMLKVYINQRLSKLGINFAYDLDTFTF